MSSAISPKDENQIIPVDAYVNLDDVVSVRVTMVEEQLSQMISKAEAEYNKAVTKQKELSEAFTKTLAVVPSLKIPEMERLKSSLEAAGFRVQVVVSFVRMETKGIIVRVDLKQTNHGQLSAEVLIDPIPKITKAHDALEKANSEMEAARASLSKAATAKSKLGAVERSARAAVAKQRLESSADGMRVLAALQKNDVSGLLGLPAGTID